MCPLPAQHAGKEVGTENPTVVVMRGLVAELNPGGLLPLEPMERTLRILTHEVIPAFR